MLGRGIPGKNIGCGELRTRDHSAQRHPMSHIPQSQLGT